MIQTLVTKNQALGFISSTTTDNQRFLGEWVNQRSCILSFQEKPASYPNPETRDPDQNVMSSQNPSGAVTSTPGRTIPRYGRNTYKSENNSRKFICHFLSKCIPRNDYSYHARRRSYC